VIKRDIADRMGPCPPQGRGKRAEARARATVPPPAWLAATIARLIAGVSSWRLSPAAPKLCTSNGREVVGFANAPDTMIVTAAATAARS
jgi:hypothetical protein